MTRDSPSEDENEDVGSLDVSDVDFSGLAEEVEKEVGTTDSGLPAEREEGLWYPNVEDIVAIHDAVIDEDEESEPGIRDPDQIQFAVEYIRDGHFGHVPETIHEKAFHLLRLIAANHWFVDGNKRTALNTTEMFYLFNGWRFSTGEDIRALLKVISVREDMIDRDVAPEFFSERSHPLEGEDIGEMGWDDIMILLVSSATEMFTGEEFHFEVDESELPDADDQKR